VTHAYLGSNFAQRPSLLGELACQLATLVIQPATPGLQVRFPLKLSSPAALPQG
jgi:hypothetical protein